MRHGVQLIAYADRFGGDLRGLRAILDGPLDGVFTGVHVLPFYRPFDGADAGFDPEDHLDVDARLGTWAMWPRSGEAARSWPTSSSITCPFARPSSKTSFAAATSQSTPRCS